MLAIATEIMLQKASIKMKVLVTGAGGYIGSQTCKLLTQEGHEVVAYDVNDIADKYCKTKLFYSLFF